MVENRAIYCLGVLGRNPGASLDRPSGRIQQGFTLVELVVTLAIMGVLSVFVAPSFNDWIKTQRVDSEIETFRMMLNYSRQQSITLNSGVTLDTQQVSRNWSGDIEIYTDADKDGNTNFSSSAGDVVLREWTANQHGLNINGNPAAGNWISFDSRGRLNESTPAYLAICDDRGKTEGKVITIGMMGRISVSKRQYDFTSRLHSATTACSRQLPPSQRSANYFPKTGLCFCQGGATMVEILVAILIFSIGMLGYAAIQTRGLKESFDNGQRTVAVWQVQELIDRVQLNSDQLEDYITALDDFSLEDDCDTPDQYCAATSSGAAEICNAAQLATFDVWDTLCNTPVETTDGVAVSEELIDVVFDLSCFPSVSPCPANSDVILTYIWISKAAAGDRRIDDADADSTDLNLDVNEQTYWVRFRP